MITAGLSEEMKVVPTKHYKQLADCIVVLNSGVGRLLSAALASKHNGHP
jgi:hypothetical protein